jgi:hypothetical protein
MLVHFNPSPDLLYTQNDLVEDGTLEKTVSIDMVSAENVRILLEDVEKLSSSLHADSMANDDIVAIMIDLYFIINITIFSPFYFMTIFFPLTM